MGRQQKSSEDSIEKRMGPSEGNNAHKHGAVRSRKTEVFSEGRESKERKKSGSLINCTKLHESEKGGGMNRASNKMSRMVHFWREIRGYHKRTTTKTRWQSGRRDRQVSGGRGRNPQEQIAGSNSLHSKPATDQKSKFAR